MQTGLVRTGVELDAALRRRVELLAVRLGMPPRSLVSLAVSVGSALTPPDMIR